MAGVRNAARGLRISGTNFIYLTEGAYGIIFVDRKQNRIRKVYRARADANVDHCREVFEAETGAYYIASSAAELKHLIPTYFGCQPNQTIMDAADNDVTGEFHRDLAFEAEFVDCDFQKMTAASQEERNRVINLFRKHGIDHGVDMSICLQDGRIIKVIDFAVREVELWW